MTTLGVTKAVEKALVNGNGILRLEPAWVARDFLPPGRRLGLAEDQYDVGDRGFICERWLASTTHADNRIGLPDEGLSYLGMEGGERITLDKAVKADPVTWMGEEYAKTHNGLGRLAKIFDYNARLPYHLHQRQADVNRVGRHSKDEAYFFPPDVDMGPHPETFFGVHPYIAKEKKYDLLLPHLVSWDSDLILRHSRAYLQVPEEGFFLPSGHLHAPGTAVTIELQEASDVFSMMQALNAGKIISKELLWKDVHPDDRKRYGEQFILGLIDWPENGNPYFYEDHHLSPQRIDSSQQAGGEEFWIYYNTQKFSGKKLVVKPGRTYTTVDKGIYNILVWKGKGNFGGLEIEGRNPGMDELIITHDRATRGIKVKNTGNEELMILKFFGPDINTDVPTISRKYKG
jgi:hypothetical protein